MRRLAAPPGWIVGLALLLCLAAPAGAQTPDARVTELRLAPYDGGTELLIATDGEPVRWTDFSLDSPPRLVVDVADARSELQRSRFASIARGGVQEVRVSQFSPEIVRVQVDLSRAMPYTILQVPEGIQVRFSGATEAFEPWTSGTMQAGALDAPAAPVIPRAQVQEQPRITATFEQADIRDVLASFAEFTGRSIVPGAGVEGTVTATIREQPWDVALQTILRAYGLAAEELPSGIIQVDAIDRLQTRQTLEPLVTRIFRINYVPVQELTATLQPLLSERGRISANASTNTLIITDVGSTLQDLSRMVSQLDVRTPQVSIQAKIIFVNRTDVEELGVTYDLKDSRGSSFNEFVSVPDPRNPGNFTNEDLVALGGNSVAALGNAATRVQGAQLEIVSSLVLGRYTLITFLDALQSAELSDVQAAPLITTLDNVEAEILVGERTPIRIVDLGAAGMGGAGAGAGGVALPRATAELVETGIRLLVTPHVTSDRRILMELRAERSGALPAAGDIGVVFQTQEARNRVMVEDGETAVIGGLTVTEVDETRAGIPFLMDLPAVGWLFRTDRKRERKRDLLIMVTPHIIEDRPAAGL